MATNKINKDAIYFKTEPVTSFEEYCNPHGIWEIKTEGDTEGRHLKIIGIFEGNITDILFAIHDEVCYNFYIRKLRKIKEINTFVDGVENFRVYLDLPRTLPVDKKQKNEILKSLFTSNNNVYIENPYSTGPITIYYGESAKQKAEEDKKIKIDKALSKLTKEEKRLLGLNNFVT